MPGYVCYRSRDYSPRVLVLRCTAMRYATKSRGAAVWCHTTYYDKVPIIRYLLRYLTVSQVSCPECKIFIPWIIPAEIILTTLLEVPSRERLSATKQAIYLVSDLDKSCPATVISYACAESCIGCSLVKGRPGDRMPVTHPCQNPR